MVGYLIVLLSLFVLVALFFRFEVGVASFLVFLFVVPLQGLYLSGFLLGTFPLLILIGGYSFVKYKSYDKDRIVFLKPFLFLLLAQAFFIPFHFSEQDILWQLNVFCRDIAWLLMPYVIINTAYNCPNAKRMFKIAFYITIIITTLYGLSLTLTPGENPYLDVVRRYGYVYDEGDQEAIINEGMRLYGYISSCFVSVTSYGIYLLLSLVYTFHDFLRSREHRWVLMIPLILILLNILICGSRTVSYTLVIISVFYLLINRKFKILLYGILSFVGVVFIISYYFPFFSDFFMSAFSDDNVAGSSVEMRMSQFNACLEEIKSNPLFGNGYKWTGWYISVKGGHPVMYAFESNIIQILCNGGIIGLLIWCIFILKYIKNCFHRVFNTNSKYLLVVLCLCFIVRSFFTGEYYGDFYTWLIIFSLMLIDIEVTES